MISETYLNLSLREQSDYISKVIILAQNEAGFKWFMQRVMDAESLGYFEIVGPGDPCHPSLSDLANPIENGPSSPQT